MRPSGLVVGIVAAIGFFGSVICGPGQSSTLVLGLSCVGAVSSPGTCAGGSSNTLRGNTSAGNNTATVAGFGNSESDPDLSF